MHEDFGEESRTRNNTDRRSRELGRPTAKPPKLSGKQTNLDSVYLRTEHDQARSDLPMRTEAKHQSEFDQEPAVPGRPMVQPQVSGLRVAQAEATAQKAGLAQASLHPVTFSNIQIRVSRELESRRPPHLAFSQQKSKSPLKLTDDLREFQDTDLPVRSKTFADFKGQQFVESSQRRRIKSAKNGGKVQPSDLNTEQQNLTQQMTYYLQQE